MRSGTLHHVMRWNLEKLMLKINVGLTAREKVFGIYPTISLWIQM